MKVGLVARADDRITQADDSHLYDCDMASGWTLGRQCEVEGCDRKHYAKGLCSLHSQRQRRSGSTDLRDRRRPEHERFDALVSQAPNGCWLWLGTCNHKGYGMFTTSERRMVLAHRWSYEHHVGKIPAGLQIDHLCRVPSCVNPSHLEPVTARENQERSPYDPAKRTHCPQGHEYTDENTYVYRGRRSCRLCHAASVAAHDAKRRPR